MRPGRTIRLPIDPRTPRGALSSLIAIDHVHARVSFSHDFGGPGREKCPRPNCLNTLKDMALCATLSRDRQNILEIRPDFLDHQAFLPVSRPSQVSIATDLKSTEYSRRLGVGRPGEYWRSQAKQSIKSPGQLDTKTPPHFAGYFIGAVGLPPSDYRRRFAVGLAASF